MDRSQNLLPVTVAIPVKNEEGSILECLDRLFRFAEVVVIDSHSTDQTRAIALNAGARVVEFDWDGKYPKKRNWFLLNEPPTQPWVLFLDADEFVDNAFCDALELALRDNTVNGFWLNYSNMFFGYPLRHGVPQKKLALFRVGKALYEKIDEDSWSDLDMEIHEHPVVDGKVGEIKVPIEHRDDRGVSSFVRKHLEYAQWETKRYLKMTTDGGSTGFVLTGRQQFKYAHLAKWWYASFYFFYTYIVRAGFLDGGAGFHYAAYKAWYFRTIRLLILEQRDNH